MWPMLADMITKSAVILVDEIDAGPEIMVDWLMSFRIRERQSGFGGAEVNSQVRNW
jgi:hypothetical protein